MVTVDVIAAVRNEAESLPVFVRELEALKLPEDVRLHAVFVEDSSTDDTRAVLRRLAREHARVGYTFLARGLGQGPAIVYGLSRSRADAQVMMDADGSHPLSVVPEMVAHFASGARIVQGVRASLRERRAWRDFGTAAFHLACRVLTGVDVRQQNVYFRLVSADAAADLVSRPRLSRYLRLPLSHRAADGVRTVSFESRERLRGESKYPPLRLLGLALDGVLSLLSPGRGALLLGGIGLAALGLARAGHAAPGLAVAAAGLGLAARYVWLGASDPVARLEAVEHAEAGERP